MRTKIKSEKQVADILDMLIAAYRKYPNRFHCILSNDCNKVDKIFFNPDGGLKVDWHNNDVENFTMVIELKYKNWVQIDYYPSIPKNSARFKGSVHHVFQADRSFNDFFCKWFCPLEKRVKTLSNLILEQEKDKNKERQLEEFGKVIDHIGEAMADEILLEE